MERECDVTANLVERVARTLTDHQMVASGDFVLVAVSGGQDSCALLDILAALRDRLGYTLVCAHLDHGLRGSEGAEALAFTKHFAQGLGCSCVVETKKAGDIITSQMGGMEEAARAARHEFLDRAAREVGANRIALGHTRDDRVETVLMNLLRGCGPEGLAGIRPVTGNRIRPLIEISRAETEAYCVARGIAFHPDSTNSDLRIRRNWVRQVLLPAIEDAYTPTVRNVLERAARLAADDAAVLAVLGREALARCRMETEAGQLALDRERLAREPLALQRRALRAAFELANGNTRNLSAATVEAALLMERGSWSVPGSGVRIVVDQRRIVLVSGQETDGATTCAPEVLAIPGITEVHVLGVLVECREEKGGAPKPENQRTWNQVLDRDRVAPPVVVRSRLPGDRIRPLGAPGSRKLQDLFVDSGVPAAQRNLVPVVADARGPLWVVGYCLDERVRLREGTRRMLRLTVRPLDGDREAADNV